MATVNLRLQLTVVQFGQFFAWGAWLITLGAYAIKTLGMSGRQVGVLYSVMGIASIVMPGLIGVVADRWVSPERLYAALHAVAGVGLLAAATTGNSGLFFGLMSLVMFAYMPTISLGYAVSYSLLEEEDRDIVKAFPRIRVWGTVGFIAAMWMVSLSASELSARQFVIAGVAEAALGIFALTLPRRAPAGERRADNIWTALGLDAFRFFTHRRLAVFFLFAATLGILLALSGNWVDIYLHDFASQPQYAGQLAVRYPAMLISLSQISEVAFILAIPALLPRLGIKGVMLMSFAAWVVRFGLLAFGDPGPGVWMIVGAMIAYGCAFDFFNIAGSLYVETQVVGASRASAQGLFMMMTNGVGAVIGALLGGNLYAAFQAGGSTDWQGFWLSCAAGALALGLLFAVAFRVPSASTQPSESASTPG